MRLEKKGYTLSQSKVRQFEDPDNCPRFWFERFVEGNVPPTPSEAMKKGLYFESLCFGLNAHDQFDEEPTSIIRNGKFTAEGSRMMEQVKRFKGWFDPKSPTFQGHEIIGIQVKVKGEVAGWYMEGIIDFITRKDGEIYLWDLKHTGDVNNDFGPYGWGDVNDVDYLQQTLYEMLYRTEHPNEPVAGTYVLVMDSSPRMGHKRIPISVSDRAFEEVTERIERFEEIVEVYNSEIWPRITNEKECQVCPVKDCPHRFRPNLGFLDTQKVYL